MNLTRVVLPDEIHPLFGSLIETFANYAEFATMEDFLAPSFPGCQPVEILVSVIESPHMFCQMTSYGPGTCEITVPLGIFYRVYIACRQLLPYWNEKPVSLINTPLDDLGPEFYKWDRLSSTFLATYPSWSEFESEFFAVLELLKEDGIDERMFHEDCLSTAFHAAFITLMHEIIHCIEQHQILMPALADDWERTPDELTRAFEIRSDFRAGALAISVLMLMAQSGQHDQGTVWQTWLRFVSGAMILFGIFDVNRNTLRNYRGGFYEHPDVRIDCVFRGVKEQLYRSFPQGLQMWEEVEQTAFDRIHTSFAHLSLVRGSDKNFSTKIHGLTVGLYAGMKLTELSATARTLAAELNDQIEELRKRSLSDDD